MTNIICKTCGREDNLELGRCPDCDQPYPLTRVLRITRHPFEDAQRIALEKAFGPLEVSAYTDSMPKDSKEFVEIFDKLTENIEIVEAVLPPNMAEWVLKFTAFSKRGGKLIRAKMERTMRLSEDGTPVLNEKGEVQMDFTFDSYERIVRIEVITEPI